MSRGRFLLIFIAALVAISGAYFLSTQRNTPPPTTGVALFPGLANEMNTVNVVIIQKGAAPSVTLRKSGDTWTVAERGDYPADIVKLRKLLSSLRDARILEEKTSDPTRYPIIGVEDPSKPDAASIEITLVSAGAKHALILGKAAGEGSFVRRAAEKPSYSVEPAISVETEPRYWIDSRLLDVPATLIQSIDVKLAAGAAYTLRRLNPADNTFSLEGVPAGRKALDGHALAPAPSTLTGLDAEDVAPLTDIDFGQASQALLTLADGTVITLTGAAIADKHWIQVKSSKDATLTAKGQGRAFEIASYRYDAIFKPLDQLLVAKEPPPAKGGEAAKAAAHVPSRAPKKPEPGPQDPAPAP